MSIFQLFIDLKSEGFVRKGNALFRVYGDGIFQTINYAKNNSSGPKEFSVGLKSMYSELKPQWFTARGCIPRYSMDKIVSQSREYQENMKKVLDGNMEIQFPSPSEILVPWFNEITTQHQLIERLCSLDIAMRGTVIWVDGMKIAPYLSCGDYANAEKVVQEILQQHKLAYRHNRVLFTAEQYEKYMEKRRAEDEKLENLLKMIQRQNHDEISNYLQNNYLVNCQYAKFCMK